MTSQTRGSFLGILVTWSIAAVAGGGGDGGGQGHARSLPGE